MLPGQEMSPAVSSVQGQPDQGARRRKSSVKLDRVIQMQRRGNRNSQIKWELGQQYPICSELLEKEEFYINAFF